MNQRTIALLAIAGLVCFQTSPAQQSTTGPTPPPGTTMGLSKLRATQVTIPGVPAYLWYRGCGPTAVGMVVGYWDAHGFPDLVSGSTSSQTADVQDAMASSRHYEDYSLPIDSAPNLLADKSELGGAHPSDCIADFMNTSWSARGNFYGWSWYSDVAKSFTGYVALKNGGYVTSSVNQYYNSSAWGAYQQEINEGRPVVLLVDSDGNGGTDHFVTGVGYDPTDSTYAAYNTWDRSIHWYRWGRMQSGTSWGVYGFTSFNINGSTTPPPPPVLSMPSNGAQEVGLNGVLEWYPLYGVSGYRVQVSMDQGFASPVYDQAGITETSLAFYGLQPDRTYYWRVNATNAAGTGDWSEVWSFTTIIAPPDVPTLAGPANESTEIDPAPTLIWHRASSASSYRVQVSLDGLFTLLVVNESAVIDTSLALGGLKNLCTYYWRVQAVNRGGSSPWSGVWKFTTIAAIPRSPILTSPADGAGNQPTTISLKWHALAEAGFYRVQLGSDSQCVSLVLDDSLLTDTTLTATALDHATVYYWRVRASNSRGPGAWSDVWRFTTIVPIPSPVSLAQPANRASITRDSLEVRWYRGSPAVVSYWLESATDSSFLFKRVDSTRTDTSLVLSHLQKGLTYWWKVRARNVAGWGQFSEVRSFSVSITGLESSDGLPKMFSLAQNYPNPFNPSTVISYQLPVASDVRLAVYDLLGRNVSVLVDERKEAGYYDVRFDGSALASGVYLYRLQAGDFVQSKKLVLLR